MPARISKIRGLCAHTKPSKPSTIFQIFDNLRQCSKSSIIFGGKRAFLFTFAAFPRGTHRIFEVTGPPVSAPRTLGKSTRNLLGAFAQCRSDLRQANGRIQRRRG